VHDTGPLVHTVASLYERVLILVHEAGPPARSQSDLQRRVLTALMMTPEMTAEATRACRREEQARWSTSVDRHLKQLVEQGVLKKLQGGLYAYPKETAFGPAPASDRRRRTRS
jgi:hypothetical protein